MFQYPEYNLKSFPVRQSPTEKPILRILPRMKKAQAFAIPPKTIAVANIRPLTVQLITARIIAEREMKDAGLKPSPRRAGRRYENKIEGNSESHQCLQYAVGNLEKIGGTGARCVLYCVCA
jgi:hypothetical protein